MNYKQQTVVIPGAKQEVVAYMMAFLAGYTDLAQMWGNIPGLHGCKKTSVVFSSENVRANPTTFAYLAPDIRVSPVSADNFIIEFDDRMDPRMFDPLVSIVQEQMKSLKPVERAERAVA